MKKDNRSKMKSKTHIMLESVFDKIKRQPLKILEMCNYIKGNKYFVESNAQSSLQAYIYLKTKINFIIKPHKIC